MKALDTRPARTSQRRTWTASIAVVTSVVLGLNVYITRSGAASDPEVLWRQAEEDLKAGRLARAEAAVAQLAVLRAPTPLDDVLNAQLALARKRDVEALAKLARVPDTHPIAPQTRLLAGQVELRRKHARAAERNLKAAIALDPGLIQAHRELIFLYGLLLRREPLADEFLALSERTPLSFDNVFHWCLTRNVDWEPKEITDDLRAFVAADPGDVRSRLALAENLRKSGRRDEARSVLSVVSENEPDARAIRARIALDSNDDRAADALLSGSVGNSSAELSRLRGRFALARRDPVAAVKHFRDAYKIEPDHRDTLFGLGQALTLAGDREAAAPFLARARDFDALGSLLQRAANPSGRTDQALLKDLGAACETIGRRPEARAWYRLAIEANPLDADAQRALFRLNAPTRPPS